jgi:hypothetical protein
MLYLFEIKVINIIFILLIFVSLSVSLLGMDNGSDPQPYPRSQSIFVCDHTCGYKFISMHVPNMFRMTFRYSSDKTEKIIFQQFINTINQISS